MSFAIATFCFGERYYQQTNRLIESFNTVDFKPQVFVVTDSVSSINKTEFVHVKDIREYDEKYTNYEKNYYGFDFSVKRFALSFAFENGFDKVILCDTDIVANETLFNENSVLNTFIENSIAGQTTYNFLHEVNTNSMLGRRFLHYEKKFGVEYDKSLLNFMPEDCIQFIWINEDKKMDFIKTWSECIFIKDQENLPNVPAGNIDEMCFSALFNQLTCENSSHKSVNLLLAKHDKWY
jgi:hypothetical protein